VAETRKVLAQLNPSATTLTTLYTVPGATQVVSSTLSVCNQDAAAGTYRVSVAIAGAVDNAKQYVAYDSAINGNQTYTWTIGMTLGATDVVRVYASNANFSFNLFGVELT